MHSVQFKPGWPLTIAMLFSLVILIGLGTWQARKIGPKTELINSIEAGLAAEPMQLPVHLDDPQPVAYRRVHFDGDALNVEPVRVFGTNLSGRPGYYLYKPVVRDFGRAVLVNFGWVPMAHLEKVALPVGPVSISGVLMLSATPGSFTPENEVEKGDWFTADVFEMSDHFGLGAKDFYHFRVFADHVGDAGALPLGGQVRVSIPNDHLEYMLTWYGLAAAMLGVFLLYGRKKALESAE